MTGYDIYGFRIVGVFKWYGHDYFMILSINQGLLKISNINFFNHVYFFGDLLFPLNFIQ